METLNRDAMQVADSAQLVLEESAIELADARDRLLVVETPHIRLCDDILSRSHSQTMQAFAISEHSVETVKYRASQTSTIAPELRLFTAIAIVAAIFVIFLVSACIALAAWHFNRPFLRFHGPLVTLAFFGSLVLVFETFLGGLWLLTIWRRRRLRL